MREELVLDVPHRQVVFTMPKMLGIFFKYKRSLLSALCLCGKEAIPIFNATFILTMITMLML